jgi:hypothetical protein
MNKKTYNSRPDPIYVAFFNCSSGISGDMVLASFIDAGVPAARIERGLKTALGIKGWGLSVTKVRRGHTRATQVSVTRQAFCLPVGKASRRPHHSAGMRRIISRSKLAPRVKRNALRIIDLLIEAESKIHRTPKAKVHFHQMSSMDTVVDAAGAALCFELAGIEKAYYPALNLGSAAPATLQIVKSAGIPVYSTTGEYELTTPTGAAIVSALMEPSLLPPVMKVEKYGFGAGCLDIPGEPNMLKVMIGETDYDAAVGAGFSQSLCTRSIRKGRFLARESGADRVVLLETNIDDMDPRVYPYVCSLLMKAGALDVWLTNIIMKQGRPGVMLSALCEPELEAEIARLIFRETTTTGIRRIPVLRYILPRFKRGKLYKVSRLSDGTAKTSVEFRTAVKKAARNGRNKPLYQILRKP